MANTESDKTPRIDVGAQQVAGIYAKALLAATEKVGQTDQIVVEFDSLISDVLDRFPKFAELLGSSLVSSEEKVEILDRTLGSQASGLLLNFLKVLASHDRLDLLHAVQREILSGYDELRGRIVVEVRAAQALDDELTAHLITQLKTMIGGEPRLVVREDPSLLGGVVLRVGDTVFDGSALTQLNRTRNEMINRSIHEIQSRRDSFRHSGGD